MRSLFAARSDALVYPSELEVYDKALYEAKESELLARQVLPLKTDDPEWAEVIGYDKLSRSGLAKIMNPLAGNIPLVDVDMTRATQLVHSMFSGWQISLTELRASRGTGRNPDVQKALTARRFMAEQENAIAFAGDAGFGIQGLLTATGRQETPATGNFASGNTRWNTATDKEGAIMVAHIRQARLPLNALDGYEAQALVLSATNMERLQGYFMSDRYDKTVIQFLKETGWFPGGIFASSTISNDKVIVLDNRPDQMQLAITMDLFRHEPYQSGPFTTLIAVEERLAGLLVRFPLAISIITGLD